MEMAWNACKQAKVSNCSQCGYHQGDHFLTYIHNRPLQPFSQDYGLASHTILCALILYVNGGTYSLTSTPNYRFLRNLFMASFFTHRVFARNLLRGKCRRNFFILMTDLGYEPRLLSGYSLFESIVRSI